MTVPGSPAAGNGLKFHVQAILPQEKGRRLKNAFVSSIGCRVAVMRALGRALRVDLHRSVCSGTFLLTVALILAWMCFNCSNSLFNESIRQNTSAPRILYDATCSRMGLAPLLFAIGTIPYAGSYLLDRSSGFENQVMERVGCRAYGLSRAFSVAISACLAAVAAMALFLGALYCLDLPAPPARPEGMGYLDLAAEGNLVSYYLVRITITGLSCGLAAEFGLMVTGWIANSFVGLMAPLVGYYLYEVLFYFGGVMLWWPTLYGMFNLGGVVFAQGFQDPYFSFLWSSVFLLAATVLCGRGFLHRLGKEMGE